MSKYLKNYAATRAATRLVMDAAQSEKAKAGRVMMPKVFFCYRDYRFCSFGDGYIPLR